MYGGISRKPETLHIYSQHTPKIPLYTKKPTVLYNEPFSVAVQLYSEILCAVPTVDRVRLEYMVLK